MLECLGRLRVCAGKGEREDVGCSNGEQVLSNKPLKSCEGAPQGCASRVANPVIASPKFQLQLNFGRSPRQQARREYAVGRPLHRFESLFTGTLPNDANQLAGGLDPLMVSYNESIYYDRAFHTQDILGSIAWARANHKVGILTAEEFSAIESGLKKVEEEWVAGTFKIIPGVDEIFTLQMREDWARSLARTLVESCTRVEAEMSRLPQICDCG